MKTADRFQNAHRRALARLMKSAAVLLSSLAPFVPASLWAATVEYDLTIARQEMNFTGHPVQAMTLNGQLPGPPLRFTEGDRAVIRVHNRMDVETSIHWHGILLPNAVDGVPFLTYPPIAPGETFTYEFDLRQYGTYWYHSHTMLQEQRGLFGALVIAPKAAGEFDGLRDHVVVLSDWTDVRDGRSIDTSMGFTPTAGLVMSTRSGDLDPGLAPYLARTEQMTTPQFYKMLNHESGLLGVSETSSDMRDLLDHETQDVRAAEAVALFCYQAKKWIGSFAAALGGLDTLVFAGGIGENAPAVRVRICEGLGFVGIELNEARNRENAPLISTDGGRVAVRVIRTDEELMIARSVSRVLSL